MPRYIRRKITKKRRTKTKKSDFQKRLRLLSLAVIVFISTILLFAIVYFWQFWQMKKSLAFSTPNSLKKQSFNFLLAGVDDLDSSDSQIIFLKLFHIDKKKNETIVFSLPVDAKVDVYPSFGTYKFAQVYALGSFAGAKNRLEVLSKTASRFLFLEINGVIVVENSDQNNWPASLSNLQFWLKIFLQKRIRTNINLLQFWQLGLNNLFVQAGLLDLENEEIKFSKNSYSQYFFDEEIINEGKKVLVLNNTNIIGLASKASQYCENLGVDVLDVSNFEENYDNEVSFIITNDKSSKTVSTIADLLKIDRITGFDSFEISSFYKRADVIVVLGLDKKDFF